MTAHRAKNKYCRLSTLKNESDVEQFLLAPLLAELEFGSDYLETKTAIQSVMIGKGKRRKRYFPDYVGHLRKAKDQPVLVMDAKNPNEAAGEGVEDAQLYASVIRRSLTDTKPDQFCIGSNGKLTIVKHYDSNHELLRLAFDDFCDGNPKFDKLKALLNREVLKASHEKKNLSASTPWEPADVSIEEIKAVFQKCHNYIWKSESLLPTEAFYEFTKLIFLKLREDNRIQKLIAKGQSITLHDLHFHVEWIDSNSEVSPHPINSILFRQLNEDLADQVVKKKKKPIFEQNEQIKLKPSTTRAVVVLLQNFNLHRIDDDLNGRMFEVFLSAAVRGKNLGAFFTPRNIVKLLVNMSAPTVTRVAGHNHVDSVLDGCCGSGGFLIDAMAFMYDRIQQSPSLGSHTKVLEEQIRTKCLYGIESNSDIARIARINMFLHGDGGSSIYRADTLDKKFHVEVGESRQSQDEIIELSELLLKQGKQFDVILTNPPFAMAYSASKPHEKRILSQYADLHPSTFAGKTKQSAKSNVLFLARYHDLLAPSGRMAIVLDNSFLNGHSFFEYRRWLLEKFILRAVISLPKYSFIQAGAGGVTSILYLEKRADDNQKQPAVFARTVRYTGINKSGKEIAENDLPDVLKEWKRFEIEGKLFLKGTKRLDNRTSDELFLIFPNALTDRIDVAYHTPSYVNLVKRIDKMTSAGNHDVKRIGDFTLAEKIDVTAIEGQVFRYVDIGAIDAERCKIIDAEIQEGAIEELPDRARIPIRKNDVIFPLSFDSFGKVAIVPDELDGQLASTGLVAVRNKSLEDAVLLWSVIRSQPMQKQFIHVASGYTQRGISTKHLGELRFPMPIANRGAIIDLIKRSFEQASEARKNELDALHQIDEQMIFVLGDVP